MEIGNFLDIKYRKKFPILLMAKMQTLAEFLHEVIPLAQPRFSFPAYNLSILITA